MVNVLRKYPIALNIFWAFLVILVPTPLLLALFVSMGSIATDQRLLIAAGIIAYTWWLLAVFLSTRPKWLERAVGLPKMYLLHGCLGVIALVLAFLHEHYMVSMGQWIIVTGKLAWYLTLFGVLFAAFFMSGWIVDHFPTAANVKIRMQKVIKHQFSIWIHRLNIVAILLVWLHVELIGRVNAHLMFMVLFELYTFGVLGYYGWYKLDQKEGKMAGKVVENRRLNAKTFQLTLEFQDNVPNLLAGDFLFFTFPTLSQETHPFSLTNKPSEKSHVVVLTIREVGDYTKGLSAVTVGSSFYAEGPFGQFSRIIESEPEKDLTLIGMGTGVAPLMSIAKRYHSRRNIHFIWTIKNKEDEFFRSELESLNDNRLKSFIQVGRVTTYELSQLLSEREIKENRFFVVGSSLAVLSVERSLKQIGVSKQNLSDERLTM